MIFLIHALRTWKKRNSLFKFILQTHLLRLVKSHIILHSHRIFLIRTPSLAYHQLQRKRVFVVFSNFKLQFRLAYASFQLRHHWFLHHLHAHPRNLHHLGGPQELHSTQQLSRKKKHFRAFQRLWKSWNFTYELLKLLLHCHHLLPSKILQSCHLEEPWLCQLVSPPPQSQPHLLIW